MFDSLRCALILPTLALIAATAPACADGVPASAAPNDVAAIGTQTFVPPSAASQVRFLSFAPDGQSLWSINNAGDLTVWASDGKTEIYRGSFPYGGSGGLRVLRDGSFVFGDGDGVLTWFEAPKLGQKLRVQREFKGPEARTWDAMMERSRREMLAEPVEEPMTEAEKQLLWQTPHYGAIAVSPDEKRVAYSFLIDSVEDSERSREVIRVWNLATGAIENEQTIPWRGFVVYDRESKTSFTSNVSLPDGTNRFNSLLAWADAQTLVVARGLCLERFNATTGELVSQWKPADSSQSLARAQANRGLGDVSSPLIERARIERARLSASAGAFDTSAQRGLAVSPDGRQLLVWDAAQKMLTLWNSATNEARILSDDVTFEPTRAKFSGDGVGVAAWSDQTLWHWAEGSASKRWARPGETLGDAALVGRELAFVHGTNEIGSGGFRPEQSFWSRDRFVPGAPRRRVEY